MFDRKVQGYADTEFYQDLRAFTISFWLKVKKDLDTGTVMSYSYGNEECKYIYSMKSFLNQIVSVLNQERDKTRLQEQFRPYKDSSVAQLALLFRCRFNVF